MTIFHLFGGYAVYSEGSFLLGRLWQGKAVYLNVVLPLLAGVMIRACREKRKAYWLEILLCILAGYALNPTAIFILGAFVFGMLIAQAMTVRSVRVIGNGIPSALICMIYLIVIYFRNGQVSQLVVNAASGKNYTYVFDTLKNFWGYGWMYPIFYLVAVVIILKWGNSQAKLYFVYAPLVLLFVIWNPLFGNVYYHSPINVTYWRLWWLLPVGSGISYAAILLFQKENVKPQVRAAFFLAGVCAIVLPGKFMFTGENGFELTQNIEKMPQDVVDLGRVIVERGDHAVLAGPSVFAYTTRQKYHTIELAYSRELYMEEADERDNRLLLLSYLNGVVNDSDVIPELLERYGVSYVIIPKGLQEQEHFLESQGWNFIGDSEQYLLFEKGV